MRIPSELSVEEIADVERRWKGGEVAARLEEEFGLRPDAIRKVAYSRQWKRDGVVNTSAGFEVLDDIQIKTKWDTDLRVEKLQSELNNKTRQYKEAVKNVVAIDRIVDIARDVIQAADPVMPLPLTMPETSSTTEHRAVALMGDVHVGEVVSAEETNNLGGYDLDTFHERLEIWANKIIGLIELRRHRLWMPELEIFMLGDIVSGDIHDELMNTNEGSVVDQVVEAANSISGALLSMSQHFERINVSCVVGNHGRISQKSYYKRKQTMSWDYLAYQMMALTLQKQENIEFHIPKSFWTIRDVLGTKFLMLHGDGIQAWSGVPWYGIQRTVLKLKEMIGSHEDFDKVVMGHFHEPIETEQFLVTGSWKGGDEYSIGKLYKSNRPSQTLLYVHPDNGVHPVGTEKVYLDKAW